MATSSATSASAPLTPHPDGPLHDYKELTADKRVRALEDAKETRRKWAKFMPVRRLMRVVYGSEWDAFTKSLRDKAIEAENVQSRS